VRYSFTGAIKEPRQVLSGGYLSWLDSNTGHWWQETWFEGDQPTFRDIGPIDQKAAGDVRAAIDRRTIDDTMKAISRGRKNATAAGAPATAFVKSSASRAAMWREQIEHILAGARRAPDDGPTRRKVPRAK
jgi:hypothetical protein